MREFHSYIGNMGIVLCSLSLPVSLSLYRWATLFLIHSHSLFLRFNDRNTSTFYTKNTEYQILVWWTNGKWNSFGLLFYYHTAISFYSLRWETNVFTFTHTVVFCFETRMSILYAYCIVQYLGSKVINKLCVCVRTNTMTHQRINTEKERDTE